MDPLLQRHVDFCNNAVLPGRRVAFCIGDAPVGWVLPEVAYALAEYDAVRQRVGGDVVLHPDMASDLVAIGEGLAARGVFKLRGEEFDVRAEPSGPVLARVDRGALPKLGIAAQGVHVNGLVRGAHGWSIWVAVRSHDKQLDPGKLDHLVAGGIAAGMDATETLVKEGHEEAGVAPEIMSRAVPVSVVSYAMERDEGLRRDVLYCYDLELDASFEPVPTDGEVERFELWPAAKVLERLRYSNDFKFNVALVLVDLFARVGMP